MASAIIRFRGSRFREPQLMRRFPYSLLKSIKQPVHRAENTADGRPRNVGADANAVGRLAGHLVDQVDIGCSLGSGTGGQGVLVVIHHLDLDSKGILHASLDRIDGAVSDALEGLLDAVAGTSQTS